MDLKKLKLKEERYSDIREKTIKVIDEYISIYNEYTSYYDNEWSNWISKIIEEFKVIYSELEFELKSEKNVLDILIMIKEVQQFMRLQLLIV
ncbi:hypothetical protein ACSXEP_02390 [Clostridium perfringens]